MVIPALVAALNVAARGGGRLLAAGACCRRAGDGAGCLFSGLVGHFAHAME